MISGVRHLGVPHKVKVCKKNVIHEHKNFVHDHHDHTMKVINDHKESCYTCNVMYFIFYGIFQIKWHLWSHFFRAFSLKYFIEYKIHHSVTVSHHALIITFMLWSWWSSCMKFLWSWITFFIYSLFMNPCLCTWTYLTNMPAGYINNFKIQHIVWHIQGITKLPPVKTCIAIRREEIGTGGRGISTAFINIKDALHSTT